MKAGPGKVAEEVKLTNVKGRVHAGVQPLHQKQQLSLSSLATSDLIRFLPLNFGEHRRKQSISAIKEDFLKEVAFNLEFEE